MLRESKQITLVRTTNIPVLHDMLWYWDQHCLILEFLGVWGHGTAVIAELLLLTNSQNLSTFPRPRVQFLVTGAKCILIIISVSHGSASLKNTAATTRKRNRNFVQKYCCSLVLTIIRPDIQRKKFRKMALIHSLYSSCSNFVMMHVSSFVVMKIFSWDISIRIYLFFSWSTK